MRIAILWTGLSGYLNACLRALASHNGAQLLVVHQIPEANAPFDDAQFSWMKDRLVWRSEKGLGSLSDRVREFDPEILVFAGWHLAPYRQVAKERAGKSWRVMTMDNCWLATTKQRLAVLASPWFPRPLADAAWLAGERQAIFARKLGFEQRNILRGLYSCDLPAMEKVYLQRVLERRPLGRAFLFVGRFIEEKGINTLAAAYTSYRERSPDPWPLICCGSGPHSTQLEGRAGIIVRGFVQPDQLPSIFGEVGCLLLPSRFEPWAVVVHEAAAAGLPILASERVGSTVHLVQPGLNGFIFDAGDTEGLARLMTRISSSSTQRLEEMSEASHRLSLQYSPTRWAETLLDGYHFSNDARFAQKRATATNRST